MRPGRWVACHYEGKCWSWEPHEFEPLTAPPRVWKAPVFEGWSACCGARVCWEFKAPQDAARWALGIEEKRGQPPGFPR